MTLEDIAVITACPLPRSRPIFSPCSGRLRLNPLAPQFSPPGLRNGDIMAIPPLPPRIRSLSPEKGGAVMKLSTTAFEPDGMIPARYTCDGDDISPELSWQDLPGGTTSLAIICDDPDAPAGTWVHWVYYDIPFQVNRLPAGVSHQERPASGGVQGVNDFGKLGYGGPCPPGGTHRYFFNLYALDSVLGLAPGVTKKQLLKAMAGHVLEHAELMGRYKR
jgi:Raf kinase inhibitor-like YbhB/YbcL family protein